MTQAEKAKAFRALHIKGTPIVLYNIWDAGSAKAVAASGAKALATGSWSVAAAQGYDDGEKLPLEFLTRIVDRITATVDLPLSVDLEGGYAVEPEGVARAVQTVIQAGAIGINFEDRVVGGEGLNPIDAQTQRIAAIRTASEDSGVPIFINARTDLFLQSEGADHKKHITEALERAEAYSSAGADGFFVPALIDPDLVTKVCEAVTLPVNAMALPGAPTETELAKLGVGRISYGPYPYRKAMAALEDRCKTESGRQT